MKRPAQYSDFEILRPLGKGRIGEVFLAIQHPFEREVALKVIRQNGFLQRQTAIRFMREVRAMGRLEHPHVIPLYAAGIEHDAFYLAMRLMHGGDLAERLRNTPVVSPDLALRWLRQVVWAVSAAHEKGVIHRDIKPQNILFDMDTAFLSDFGLARVEDMSAITEIGQTLGTPLYMAPELFEDATRASPASDVYALGVIAYRMLAGRHPFLSPEEEALPLGTMTGLLRERGKKVENLASCLGGSTIETVVREIILQCLDSDPANRYDSATVLLQSLQKTRLLEKGDTE